MSIDWMNKLGAATPLGNGRLLVPYTKGPAPDDIKMDFVREHGPLEVRVPTKGEKGSYEEYTTFELTPEMSKAARRAVASAVWKRPLEAEVTKIAKKRITKEDIHQKAESLGIIWDYDKPGSEPFLRHSVRVTGKTHVDDMTPGEVEALYDSLEAMEKKAEEQGHWRRLKPGQKGKGPGGTLQMGRTWVRKSRMREGMKPMPHQADFTKAVKQQLGKKKGGGIIAAHGTGTGKCVRGDTLVLTDQGLLPIRDLFGSLDKSPEDELYVLAPGLRVLSVVGRESRWVPVRCLYRQRLPDDEATLVITTRMGAVEPTLEHHYPVIRMGAVQWVRASEITSADFLAVPHELPEPPELSDVSDDLVELLAWQIAEGHEVVDAQCVITQKDEGVLRRLQELYRRVMPSCGSGHIYSPTSRCSFLQVHSASYREYLSSLGYVWGRLSAEKEIPSFLFHLPNRQVAIFLRAFFDAEAHSDGRIGVEISTASKRLASQLQYMLARLGVRAALHEKEARATNGSSVYRTYYRLHISGESAAAFHERVGFGVEKKAEALDKVASKNRNPNTGVPVGDLLRDLAARGVTVRALGLSTRQARYETLSRKSVEVIAENLRRLASSEIELSRRCASLGGTARRYAERTLQAVVSCGSLMLEYAERLEVLLSGPWSFERIESVGVGESGGFVYDIEVDSDVWEDKNYVAGPVLLQHNTFSAINAFEELKGDGKAGRALVLTPAGLRDNFLVKGINKFTTSKGVILKKPAAVSDDTEYVVVSYDAFRQNPDAWIDKVKPDTIIADEVHRAANPAGKTYQALRQARERVPRFMGLTASIVQNKPKELVPLLDLATAGETPFKSQRQFQKSHVARKPSQQRGIFGGRTYEQKLIRTALLKSSVGESVHYIEDLDASKKPAKFVETVNVSMSKDQIKLYRDAMKGLDPVVRKKIAEGQEVSKSEAKNVFLRLMRARQVSNSIHLGTPHMSLSQSAEKTPKIKKILDDASSHIRKTPDAQIVMYTNLVHGGVDVLEAGLKKRKIPYGIFAGRGVEGVTEETRQKAVEDYIAGKNKVIIITGAGAEGLSLGNTTMVQLVDGHYNPERISQAEARGVRAGGLSHRPVEERKVRVRRYVSALPKTFWQTVTFKPAEKSVGQWVYMTAGKKERLNRQLRDVLKKRSEHEKKQRESLFYRLTRPDWRLS
jgi:intein/homing endonuclease